MADSFEIQTETQVNAIESKKQTYDSLNQIANISNNINADDVADKVVNQLSDLVISTDTSVDIDKLENKINNINTGIIESQVQDILIQIDKQKKQINGIEEKINMILEKIDDGNG